MKLTKLSLAVITALGIGLSGCGSSSSSDGDQATTTGTVSGSYYENAIVCFDTDGDGSCTGEASRTTSDSKGDFSLVGDATYPIIAEIPAGAKKHEVIGDAGVEITPDTQTVFAIPADAITKAKEDGGKVVLSAISTKLYTYVKEHKDDDIDTAMVAVSDILGISKDDMFKDFNSKDVDEHTRLILKSKSDVLLEKIKGKADIKEVSKAVDNFVAAMSMPEPIDVIKAK